MKTRISSDRNKYYELIIDEGRKKNVERRVLAAMTLFEGTGAWMLKDIRLSPYEGAHRYSGGLYSDDITCRIKPETEAEAAFYRSKLHTFTEDENGFKWSTYSGLVVGTPREDSWISRNNHVGFFTRAEGLAYLRSLQPWWDEVRGNPDRAKIPNPKLQPSSTILHSEWRIACYKAAQTSEVPK